MVDLNQKQISYSIIGVFGSIFLLLIIYGNTDYYKKSEYEKYRKISINSIVIHKKDTHPTKANEVSLKSGRQIRVQRNIFDAIQIGDSIIKKSSSDSVYYYTSNGLFIIDENSFRRNKIK